MAFYKKNHWQRQRERNAELMRMAIAAGPAPPRPNEPDLDIYAKLRGKADKLYPEKHLFRKGELAKVLGASAGTVGKYEDEFGFVDGYTTLEKVTYMYSNYRYGLDLPRRSYLDK